MKKLLLILALIGFMTLTAYGALSGTYTSNSYFYRPGYGSYGQAEFLAYNNALEIADAQIEANKTGIAAIDFSLYYLKTEIDTLGEVETIWIKDITDSDELASALADYYLKTAIDSQGEVETIWGVSLANDSELHNVLTLGTASGLSLSTQVLSLAVADTNTTGALNDTDWDTFNDKIGTEVDPTVDSDAEIKAILVDEVTKTGDFTGGRMAIINNSSGIIEQGTNTDTEVADAVTKKHTQNSDTDLDATFEATFAKKADKLSVFAATTSSELDGVISDDTGSDALVFANTPTLVTPELGVATATSINFGDEALSVYDEGTWTIGISFGGGTTGITYSANEGFYTKMGNIVHITGLVTLTSKGSSVGDAKITGLPFTIINNSAAYPVPTLFLYNITFANQFMGRGNINETTIGLYEITEGATRTQLTDANFADDSYIMFGLTYLVE